MLDVGQRVERYEVIDVLGEGGMAVVYRVRHATLGTDHALKVLTIQKESVRARLVREGQAQARLRHPNVVAVHDVLEVGGAPALLMEFVEGNSLAEWLRRHRPALEDGIALFMGILAGVQRAHDLGMVHRDLKPGNVLMMPSHDGGWVPKVADFGLVKAVEEDGSGFQTRTGMAMGTPAFMAPEQFRDAKSVDHRADIFSLGCILYCIVCGRPPYEGTDLFELITNINNGRYVPPQRQVEGLPPFVDMAIEGALTADRERRIPDCATFGRVLSGELQWPPTGARVGSDTMDPDAFGLLHPAPAGEGGGRPPAAGLETFDEVFIPGSLPPGAPTHATPPARPAPERPQGTEPTLEPERLAPEPAPARPTLSTAGTHRNPTHSPQTDDAPAAAAPSGRGAGLALGVVGILAVGGVAAFFALGPPGEQPSGVEPSAVSPVPALERAGSDEAPVPSPAPPVPDVEPEPEAVPARARAAEPPERSAPPVEDVPPASAPAPAAPPAPAPAAPPAPGTISVEGGGAVRLLGASGRLSPGSVPPGTYTIQATFGGVAPIDAGTVTVGAGESVQLVCNALARACSPR